MLVDEGTDFLDVIHGDQRFQIHHAGVALPRERIVLVQDVRDAAAHARREVAPGRTEDDHATAGHVLAAVVADAFDHRMGAAVANAEPLGGDPPEKALAGGGAVEHDVADQDLLLRPERARLRRIDDEPAAGETLADVVVGVSFDLEGDTLG